MLNGTIFSAPIRLEVAAPELELVKASFQDAVSLRVRLADIALDRSSFAGPSTISFAATTLTHEMKLARVPGYQHWLLAPRPRLLSVRQVDVANLVLSDLDLSACLFRGASNLDKLRLEGPLRFARTPSAWRIRVGRWRLPIWRRWMRREALAEEHLLHAPPSPEVPEGDQDG